MDSSFGSMIRSLLIMVVLAACAFVALIGFASKVGDNIYTASAPTQNSR
jgi:hypothetical protein